MWYPSKPQEVGKLISESAVSDAASFQEFFVDFIESNKFLEAFDKSPYQRNWLPMVELLARNPSSRERLLKRFEELNNAPKSKAIPHLSDYLQTLNSRSDP